MATVSGDPVQGGGAPVRSTDKRLWWTAVGLAVVAIVVYASISTDAVVLRNVWYPAVELAAVAAILAGVHRYQPDVPRAWLLIAGALSVFLIGDTLWAVYAIRGEEPWPSPADAFYLAGYPLLAAGLVISTRRRARRQRDSDALIDAALVTATAGLVLWIYIIEPALGDDELSVLEKMVTIAYPIGDLVLLAVAARFVMRTRWDVVSLRVLVAGLVLTLLGDLLYSLDLLGRLTDLAVGDVLLLGSVLLIGLAGLHPSMTELTAPDRTVHPFVSPVRLVLLLGLVLVPPGLLFVRSVADKPLHIPATVAAMVIAIGLVAARLTVITVRASRAADREAVLSRYAAELLGATGRDELVAVADRAAGALAQSGEGHVVQGEGTTDSTAFAAPVEVRGELVAEVEADASATQLRSVRHSLTTVAAQLALAIERDELLANEREAAESLAVQNERLLELDRMKDGFVSSVSHELRTPLTSMIGYLEIVLDDEVGELNEEQRHFLEIVDRNCGRLVHLIEDILFVSRLDEGRFKLDRSPVDLGRLAADAVQTARPAADARELEVRLAVEDGLPSLSADASRLTQVFDNLISNAIKFTPEHGTVTVSLTRRDGLERLEVADNGVGVPADELPRLFDRFFRASTSAVAQGTGLGLPIVKSIVEAHGGTISVESELGVGTTMTVDLPLEPAPTRREEVAGDGAPARA